MKYWGLLFTFVLLLTSACDRQSAPGDSRQAAVEAAVTWYDALLADGYRTLNMNALAQVATPEIARKAYYQMAAVGEAGLKMDSTLQQITFAPLKEIAPDTVTIAATENWQYVYWEIETGKRLFDNSVQYRLTYTLTQPDDTWLVSDITIEKTEESKDSSFIFQRPADQPPGRSRRQAP